MDIEFLRLELLRFVVENGYVQSPYGPRDAAQAAMELEKYVCSLPLEPGHYIDGLNKEVGNVGAGHAVASDRNFVAVDAKSLPVSGCQSRRNLPDELSSTVNGGFSHNESSHGCVDADMIGLGAVGVKSTASAIEARAKRLFGGGV